MRNMTNIHKILIIGLSLSLITFFLIGIPKRVRDPQYNPIPVSPGLELIQVNSNSEVKRVLAGKVRADQKLLLVSKDTLIPLASVVKFIKFLQSKNAQKFSKSQNGTEYILAKNNKKTGFTIERTNGVATLLHKNLLNQKVQISLR